MIMSFVNTVDVMGDEALQDLYLYGNLTELRDDAVVSIGVYGLAYQYRLVTLDLPNLRNIDRYAMAYSNRLVTIILRGNAVCTLESTTAFTGAGLKTGTGYVYVPAALKAQYMQATNWSTYASQFRALEDYTVDGTIWGDLDPNKI